MIVEFKALALLPLNNSLKAEHLWLFDEESKQAIQSACQQRVTGFYGETQRIRSGWFRLRDFKIPLSKRLRSSAYLRVIGG